MQYRLLFGYALVLPLAILLGFMMADPNAKESWALVGFVLLVISTPLLYRWHFPLLLFSWNMTAMVFFVPGHPKLWLLMAGLSCGLTILRRSLGDAKFPRVGMVALPALYIAAVVFVTAQLRGGIGLNAFGSDTIGGGRYILIFGAILGLFAFMGNQIPKEKVKWAIGLFFLGALFNTISILAPFAPNWAYFVFQIFPVSRNDLGFLAIGEGYGEEAIMRFYGLSTSAEAFFCYLLAKHGFRNTIEQKRFGVVLMLLVAAALGSLGGFRSMIILMGGIIAYLAILEGVHRTRYAAGLFALVLVIGAVLIPTARHLPLSVQRSLSFLPLELNHLARENAAHSSTWRLELWRGVLPTIPEYLIIGKGLSLNPHELHLINELRSTGRIRSEDAAIYSGDYHNGPLTTLVPFGIFGLVGFLWFNIVGIRALYLNWKFGDVQLRSINTLLFALLIAKTMMFWVVFGNFYTDLAMFAGLIGFSISLNHGICRRPVVVEEVVEEEKPTVPTFAGVRTASSS